MTADDLLGTIRPRPVLLAAKHFPTRLRAAQSPLGNQTRLSVKPEWSLPSGLQDHHALPCPSQQHAIGVLRGAAGSRCNCGCSSPASRKIVVAPPSPTSCGSASRRRPSPFQSLHLELWRTLPGRSWSAHPRVQPEAVDGRRQSHIHRARTASRRMAGRAKQAVALISRADLALQPTTFGRGLTDDGVSV